MAASKAICAGAESLFELLLRSFGIYAAKTRQARGGVLRAYSCVQRVLQRLSQPIDRLAHNQQRCVRPRQA
jgi:hypothetical protein